MKMYDQEAVDRINGLGVRMRNGLQEAMKKVGIKGQAMGYGSLIVILWSEKEVINAKDALKAFVSAGELPKLLHLEMLSRGIYFAGRGMFSLSTPMTETEIDKTVAVFEETIEMLKPYVAETLPYLLSS